ncbi:MAG: sulfatase, partial [Armatimonadota bacterium]|nr:sulfatase [Armatimonadota bacterium]
MKPTCTRRDFLAGLGASAAMAFVPTAFAENNNKRLNVLLITADDMNFDSLGVAGCKVPDITPNLDSLASQGIRFTQAHVTSAICQPSRSALMTGRYPHRNGALGFQPINENVPTLQESLRKAGYFIGIMAKVEHLMPKWKFCWDVEVNAGELGGGRNPKAYYEKSKAFFEQAKAAGKPFFLMANSTDPHRPFPSPDLRQNKAEIANSNISRIYKPEEITVPPFLPDRLHDVRKELAQYYTAVHRCDETVGQILQALRETGFEENTIVFFLSDNGISEPFAKTNCYYTSTATPLIIRWHGKVKPGTINNRDLVSG